MPGTNPVPVAFSGVTTNRIVFAPGAVTVGAAFSMAAVVRPAASAGTFRAILGPENAAPGTDQFLLLNNSNQIYVQLPTTATGATALSANTWYLVAVTKAAGSSAPRLHLYNFGTPGWTRLNTSASASWSDTVDHLAAGTFAGTQHPFAGHAAVYGIWLRALADAELDTMIVNLDAWQTQAPTWWSIANGATAMIDETGGTGDETSRGVGVTNGSAQTSPLVWAVVAGQTARPDADITTTGWATAPLWSKLDETPAGGDIVTATAAGTTASFPSRWHIGGSQILNEVNAPLGLLLGFNVHVHPETHTNPGFVWAQSHYDAMGAAGCKLQRCTLHWDSLQPTNEATVNAAMLTDIDTAVARAGNAGMYSVLEIHFNVNRAPAWAAGFGWETDAFMGHGQTVTEALATRYTNDKRVVGLSWNEIPIVPTADLLTFHQTCVPWYRNIATAWPLWIVPSAYGLGTPYPASNLDANIASYLALDTNGIGLIAEYHHYFVESGTGSDDGYQFNGAPDPVSQVGASGSNYGGVYSNTASALADLGRHVQPWKDWQDSGSGRVVTAVGEWAYLHDGGMTGQTANNYQEFATDIIGTFRERNFAVEMWWNYDTTTNPDPGTGNPFSARPGSVWRPSVQAWFDWSGPAPPALSVANGFETGLAAGTAITIANSDDNAAGTIANAVDQGGVGSSIVFDTAQAADGTRSLKFTQGATPSHKHVYWDTGTQTTYYGRVYYYATANPSTDFHLVSWWTGSADAGYIDIRTDGRVAVVDSTFTQKLNSGAGVIALNAWNRIEWQYVAGVAAGTVSVKVFLGDSTTEVYSGTSTAGNFGAQATLTGQIMNAVAASHVFWIDNFGGSTVGYPGPA